MSLDPTAQAPSDTIVPECSTHTPSPLGYVAHSEWAEEMRRTHIQKRCPDCLRWVVWVPKS